jgi:microcystin-dependent protein
LTSRDDLFRDKFRTGDGALVGSVLYSVLMPDQEWFWAQVADTLLALTIADNWEQVGDVSIDDAIEAGSNTFMSFQSMVGTIFPVAWEIIPDSYLVCDGATYDRVDYPVLYAALPSAFIVDADHFMVPDLGGRTIIGANGTFAVGDTGGETDHTLDVSEMPSHTHTDVGHTHTTGNSLTGVALTPGELPVLLPNPIPALTGSGSANNANTGGDGAHNNMQPYQAITYVIAAR